MSTGGASGTTTTSTTPLVVAHVQWRKVEGRVRVVMTTATPLSNSSSSTQLAFESADGKTRLLTVPVEQVKGQSFSPPTAAKASLKVTLLDDSAHIFRFMGGTSVSTTTTTEVERLRVLAMRDRDTVRDALTDAVNRHRVGVASAASVAASAASVSSGSASASASASVTAAASTSASSSTATPRPPPSTQVKLTKEEIRARQALLAKNAPLRKLHRELVMTRQITEEEFWEPRLHQLRAQIEQERQRVGLATAMEHEVRPSVAGESGNGAASATSGGGGGATGDIKFTLTPQIIQSMFLHHPALRQAYREQVPDKMSEREFWTRCLQSAFFHRDRLAVTGTGGGRGVAKDPIFDRAAAQEEEEMKRGPGEVRLGNILLDLGMTHGDRIEDYGNEPDISMRPGRIAESQPIIRKLNHHGRVVVENSVAVAATSAVATTKMTTTTTIPRYKQLLRDMTVLDDLQVPEAPATLDLEIDDRQRYFGSSSQDDNVAVGGGKGGRDTELGKRLRDMADELVDITRKPIRISAVACVRAFQETNAAFAAARRDGEDANPSALLPADTYAELCALHDSVHEVLRHFWSAHPPTSAERASKRARMVRALQGLLDRMGGSGDDNTEKTEESAAMEVV